MAQATKTIGVGRSVTSAISTAPREKALSIRAVEDMLREAEILVAQHDGIHGMHSSRACLVTILSLGRWQGHVTRRESETARQMMAQMRYASHYGYFPRPLASEEWRSRSGSEAMALMVRSAVKKRTQHRRKGPKSVDGSANVRPKKGRARVSKKKVSS